MKKNLKNLFLALAAAFALSTGHVSVAFADGETPPADDKPADPEEEKSKPAPFVPQCGPAKACPGNQVCCAGVCVPNPNPILMSVMTVDQVNRLNPGLQSMIPLKG